MLKIDNIKLAPGADAAALAAEAARQLKTKEKDASIHANSNPYEELQKDCIWI